MTRPMIPIAAVVTGDEELEVVASRGAGLEPIASITNAVVETGAAILTSRADVGDDDADSDQISIDVRWAAVLP